MRLFLLGGTGLIGSRLVPRLQERQDEILLLTRRPEVGQALLAGKGTVVVGDAQTPGPWQERLAACDAVINLAGENLLARRWNEDFKKVLRDSRLRTTQQVVAALQRQPTTAAGAPKVLINASAIGYYGPHGDEELTEDSPPGNDFMAQLCVDWEKAARQAESAGVRVVLLRIGVVLDKAGGALAQLLTPFRLFVGGPVGSGRQWMSWIHYEDVTGLILWALEHTEARGPFNATAPQPVTNRQFVQALGRVLRRPSFLPAPAFALRLLLGEVAQVLVTGQRVLPRRALELGYSFRYPDLDSALRHLLG